MSKLTDEQLEHYLKGGRFRAKYNPPRRDISPESFDMIGEEIIVEQNMLNGPIQCIAEYRGQHAFNSPSISGWFPEEDIEILEIIDSYKDNPEPTPVYLYRMHYSTREQVVKNFGNAGREYDLPMVVGRQYVRENDQYIKDLSSPPADRVEKCVWDPSISREVKFEEI